MEGFLTEQNVPEPIQRILKLAGIGCIEDLKELSGEFILDIENQIRTRQINLVKERIKYYGLSQQEPADWNSFSFRLLDRKKLTNLPDAVAKKEAEKL